MLRNRGRSLLDHDCRRQRSNNRLLHRHRLRRPVAPSTRAAATAVSITIAEDRHNRVSNLRRRRASIQTPKEGQSRRESRKDKQCRESGAHLDDFLVLMEDDRLKDGREQRWRGRRAKRQRGTERRDARRILADQREMRRGGEVQQTWTGHILFIGWWLPAPPGDLVNCRWLVMLEILEVGGFGM